MRIKTLRISNFKSIRSFTLNDVESALILVGKNSVGKTVVLDALRAVAGLYTIQESDYNPSGCNITV